MLNRAYRYRIYPDEQQKALFAKTFDCVRFIYNKMLTDKIAHYQATGETLKVTPASYKAEYPWLKEVDSLALANAQSNLQAAFRNFFKNNRNRYPKYHSKKKTKKAYTTNRVKQNIAIIGKYLKLPKAGLVRIKLHRQIPETDVIKSVTVCLEADGKYYVSIMTEYEMTVPVYEVYRKKAIGLDYSSAHFYVDSEGHAANIPHFYRKAETRLAREQRKLSKMIPGSSNYMKQQLAVGKLHTKVRNQRKDWQHKESRRIADTWDIVCVEDINLSVFTQRWNLAKPTNDNAFGQFRQFLSYKLAAKGKVFITIDKWYPSTKRCSCCGHINADLSLEDRSWICPACVAKHDRDINAAINIREAGLRLIA